MKPAPFAYARARSLDHAIALLRDEVGSAHVLAGGQSLVPSLNMRLSQPGLLVDINGIPDLDRITLANGDVEIGALVRHAQAEHAPDIVRHAPLIARALPHIAHPAIRNRGTLCGSVAFADPAAELPACLLALDGEVEIAGSRGRRTVKAEDFFQGLYQTAIEPDEVLAAIRVPAATPAMRFGFCELVRRHGDYAICGLAASARAEGDGLMDVRLVYFAVGTGPVRARKAEASLQSGDLEEAVKALADDLDPPDDVFTSGKTKTYLAGGLLKRVAGQLKEARP